MFQSTTLVGSLGSDPVSRTLPGGDTVVSFSVAVNKTWKDAQGQRKEKTTWWRVSCWRKLAEIASTYLTKGSKVLIMGDDAEARAYQNRDGQWVASLEITAQTLKLLSPKGETVAKGTDTGAPMADDDPEMPF
jgi:single-strand DNA-binding protein